MKQVLWNSHMKNVSLSFKVKFSAPPLQTGPSLQTTPIIEKEFAIRKQYHLNKHS
jgi:hypothetical protein